MVECKMLKFSEFYPKYRIYCPYKSLLRLFFFGVGGGGVTS